MTELDDDARRSARRRIVLLALVIATALPATFSLYVVLAANGLTWMEGALIAPVAVAFAWLGLSFWSAMIGIALTVAASREADRDLRGPHAAGSSRLTQRVAIVTPIYNEDVGSVFTGLAAMVHSLSATGQPEAFDFFVLSDSTDRAIVRAERQAWRALRARGPEFDRVFYRHRAQNVARKAGNIADWVRRWGAGYECMVVLDADSLMEGETLVRLAAAMEHNPHVGVLQTVPLPVRRGTVFARALQFSASLYARTFAVGWAFWQRGESTYYGHNAIIRVRAFAAHCGLPVLPGAAPLGGEILSHDFVEAALIRRGGWSVWLLPEIGGSYEEIPANLLAYAARDRRWAQGNLQHGKIVAAHGLHACSRLNLVLGILGYLMAPIWLLMLVLTSAVVIDQALSGHRYFGAEMSLFPMWPEHRPLETGVLLAVTACLLWLPKILVVAWTMSRQDARRQFGGGATLLASAIAEILFSALIAPVMMLFHTTFVAQILTGQSVGWPAQPRQDQRVAWSAAARRHVWHVALGVAWALSVWRWAPQFLAWLAPVVGAMMLSMPLTVMTSRVAARSRLFITPQESTPPPILRLAEGERRAIGREERAAPPRPALVDPDQVKHARATACRPAEAGGAER